MPPPRRPRPSALLAAMVLASLLAGPSHAQWTDVTNVALADTLHTHDKKGAALVDFDGDGDLDVACAGEGLRALLLCRNDGGTFVDVTPAALDFPGSGSSLTWGDLDHDGDPDLFLVTEESRTYLFRNDGGGAFQDVTSGPLLDSGHGHSSAWVDADVDGDLDLYVANLHTASRLFENTYPGPFVDATVDSLGILYGDGVAWGDYDNDGDPDVYLARFSFRPNRLLRNDGGTFVDVTGTGPLATTSNGHSCSWADYDNDGDLDLYIANAFDSNRLLRNDGGGMFTNATPPELVLASTHSVGMSWLDYDNDGWNDLYVTTTDEGPSHLFRNLGGGAFADVTTGPLAGSGTAAGAAAGDVDGDGDLDLYLTSYLRRANRLLQNDLSNGNHWLEVELEGTLSNRSAIGARVTIDIGGQRQIREISGCTGFRSQSALAAHFGLGLATTVDRVIIRWPSGTVQETTLVAADQKIHVVEKEPSLGVPRVGPTDAATIVRAAPNPFRSRTRIDWTLAARAPIELDVIDLAGRRVRRLDAATREAGRHAVEWNGRDDGGATVRSGVYFVRLSAAGQTTYRRVVALRD